MTQIDIDDDALERAMSLSKVRTKKGAVNLAREHLHDAEKHAR